MEKRKWLKMPKSEETFAERIQMAAYKKNMTLRDLAEECGLDYNTFMNQRRKAIMRAYNLIKVCEVLDCSADYLLFGKRGE